MSKPLIFPLFSTPVYVNNVGPFERPDLAALTYSSTLPTGGAYNFLSSVDKRVLHRPEFKHVHDIVMREVNVDTRELLAVSRTVEFYITDSWINRHRRGHSELGPYAEDERHLLVSVRRVAFRRPEPLGRGMMVPGVQRLCARRFWYAAQAQPEVACA
jgi:hypothetical protein